MSSSSSSGGTGAGRGRALVAGASMTVALAVAVALALGAGVGPVAAQEALRPDFGRPLQQAEDFVRKQRFREALTKIKEAEGVGARNANERYLLERMRIAAASGAGDADTAARAFDAIVDSGRLTAAEKLQMMESIAVGFYRAQQYAKSMQWAQRYLREGGNNTAIRTMLVQSQYLSGDYAGASRELRAEIAAAERSNAVPPEDRLKLLLNAATKTGDDATYVHAIEKLVAYYPRKEYWADLLSRMQRQPGFSDRLSLDAYRLSLATGSMTAPTDFMEMAQLALQADLPAEGKQVVDKGFAVAALGSGEQAERHHRLRDLVEKRLAEDKAGRAEAMRQAEAEKAGDALLVLGMNLVHAGQAAEGVKAMQKGLARGGLKRAEDAKLHLGIAQYLAGDRAAALATFKTVQGADGTADLARLWALYVRRA